MGMCRETVPNLLPKTPFYGALHLMTFNVNVMFTKIKCDKTKVRKYVVLAKYLTALAIDFLYPGASCYLSRRGKSVTETL